MSDQRNQIEEQLLDTLLVESLGKVEPPDLTERVLTRLSGQEPMEDLRPVVSAAPHRSRPVTSAASPRHRVAAVIALVAAVAASILLVSWLRLDQGGDDAASIAANESGSPVPGEVIASNVERNSPTNHGEQPSVPSRGIPLVMESGDSGSDDQLPDDISNEVLPQKPVPAVTLVSKRFDQQLERYWNAVGIEPANEADPEEVVAKLSASLGIKLPAGVVADPERLRAEFASGKFADEIAGRWLQQITDRGLQRLDEPSRDGLIEDLAACVQGKQPFDQTVVGWIRGDSPRSSSFYQSVSHAGRDAMARRLAALTMNVDLRCIRCHDSKIEGSGRQHDYWGFSALLARGVARDAEGRVTIDPSPNKSRPLFYELADGRQRLAEPFISTRWIDTASGMPAESVKDWATQLIGSEAMARGAVNSLWQLVHGQPLRGRVVDPITAPHNDLLDQIQDELVQDLIDSQFDVARTLALIIASPATRRAVPSPLLPENALVVTESERRKAMDAVNAFAAALPRHTDLPLAQRVDQTMRAIGGKLDQDGRPFVAQISGTGDERREPNNVAKPLAVDFPVRGESLPVQWLTLINDDQSQIDHLGYLAGMQKLPANVTDAVTAMRKDEQLSKELMLNRVWWLVRP